MTNKIIIDGIDVSECIHISNFENVLFVCEETGRKCEVSKNCYYKQLKRKEQECEEHLEEIESLQTKCQNLQEFNDYLQEITRKEITCEECYQDGIDVEKFGHKMKQIELERECKELKKEIAFGSNGKLSDKIRATVFKDLNDENAKYKKALDDIKSIADQLYYQAIKDPVKREKAIRTIIDIIDKAREEWK